MKLGINSTFQHHDARQWASQLHELGCKSAVFPVTAHAEEAVIQQYVEAAQEFDLTIAEVGIWKNMLSPDPLERRQVLDFSVAQLKLADRINARCCVNVTGAKGPIWDGPYKENFSCQTWKEAVSTIQEIIDRAAPTKTDFTIEPMPWMYPTDPDEYLALIDAVNRPHFGVHMDLANMISSPKRYFFHEKFIDECFDKLGPFIRSCHIKDIRLDKSYTVHLKETFCGDGALNLEHYAQRIQLLDPDMPVLIEHLHSEEEYRESLNYVKKRLYLFL